MNCCTSSGTEFWATNPFMDPDFCATGEPDYSPDSDSLLTSPPIDLYLPNQTLTKLNFSPFFCRDFGWNPNTQKDGFSQVLIDHDGDGIFTPLITSDFGLGEVYEIDIQNNPDGNSIDPLDTNQFIQLQFRFRSLTADDIQDATTLGWTLYDVFLEWKGTNTLACDQNPCAPGDYNGSPDGGSDAMPDLGRSRDMTDGMPAMRTINMEPAPSGSTPVLGNRKPAQGSAELQTGALPATASAGSSNSRSIQKNSTRLPSPDGSQGRPVSLKKVEPEGGDGK
jgi:hypothetical protein